MPSFVVVKPEAATPVESVITPTVIVEAAAPGDGLLVVTDVPRDENLELLLHLVHLLHDAQHFLADSIERSRQNPDERGQDEKAPRSQKARICLAFQTDSSHENLCGISVNLPRSRVNAGVQRAATQFVLVVAAVYDRRV